MVAVLVPCVGLGAYGVAWLAFACGLVSREHLSEESFKFNISIYPKSLLVCLGMFSESESLGFQGL